MKKVFYFFFVISSLFFLFTQDLHSKNLSEDEQLIKVGIGAFNDGFYDIAEKQFSQFLKYFTTHGKTYEICYLLGRTFLIKGKLKEAKPVFLRIITESKSSDYMDYTLFWAAEVEMKLGNGEEAKKLLLSLIKRFPKFERIDYSYYLLGLLDLGTNKLNQAESSLKKVSLLSKDKEIVRSSLFWLGVLTLRQNAFEAAIHYFQMILEDPKSLPQEYIKVALFWLGEAQFKLSRFSEAKLNYRGFYERYKNDSFTPTAYWRLGYCEYRLGNIKESIEIFQSFKNQFKDSPLILSTYYLLGEIFLIRGDYASSIKELNFILHHPQGDILKGLSLLALYWNYIHLGEMEEANKMIQRLQRLSYMEEEKLLIQWLNAEMVFSDGKISDSFPYYFNMVNTRFRERSLFKIGKGYFLENKFREAVTNLDILLLEFPNSPYLEESLFMKGECLNQLGEFDRALETYGLILNQKKKLWQPLALIQIGNIHLSRNENEKAKEVFNHFTSDFPKHPLFDHAAFQLGNLNFKENDMIEAIHYYSVVIKGNSPQLLGAACFRLGEVFYQEGKYEKAFASFQRAVQNLKENSMEFLLAQLEMGNLHRRWGRYEEARKSFEIILQQSKDEALKKAAEELLNRVESH